MKLSSIPIILATAAGLVSAAPIRAVAISSVARVNPLEPVPVWAQSIRWGHAAAPAFGSFPLLNKPNLAGGELLPIEYTKTNGPVRMRQGGCRGGMRAKSMELGNKLRIIIGLPPVEWLPRHPYHGNMRGVVVEALPQPTHHRHHMHLYTQRPPFTARLSRALAALGPWEGRAVSFVLGCGLGVILRMLFVFSVLIVRSVRARRQERGVALEEDTVIFVADVKEVPLIEALPAYVEKPAATPEDNNVAH